MAKHGVLLAAIKQLCKEGQVKKSLEILESINHRDTIDYLESCLCLLQVCTKMKTLEEGKQVHLSLLNCSARPNIFTWNTLISMYISCGSLEHAYHVFGKMLERNVFTWTIMIAGYAQYGDDRKALSCAYRMQEDGILPDKVTFVNLLSICGDLLALEQGKWYHAGILRSSCARDMFVGSALVNMYVKCGIINEAIKAFHVLPHCDIVTWNALVAGYAQHEFCREAVQLFEMLQEEKLKPNTITFVNILGACVSALDIGRGKWVHASVLRTACGINVFVGNTLIDMYSKCGRIEDACEVFGSVPTPNLVSWNAVIAGCSQQKNGIKAVQLFTQMKLEHVLPDKVTFISLLNACAGEALDPRKEVYANVLCTGWESDIYVGSTIIDMLCKCGNVEDACKVFDRMPTRNIVTWNGILAGYAQHGNGKEAFKIFWKMQQEGLKPNCITFMSVLSACSEALFVDEGCHFFCLISQQHDIAPVVQHYACMGDLISRGGQLDMATDLIQAMPMDPSVQMWSSFADSCS